MKAITIRGIDTSVAEKVKQTAKREGKSVNRFILEMISQSVGEGNKKRFSSKHGDLDNLFGRWSQDEFEKIQGFVDIQRKIDTELWQ